MKIAVNVTNHYSVEHMAKVHLVQCFIPIYQFVYAKATKRITGRK